MQVAAIVFFLFTFPIQAAVLCNLDFGDALQPWASSRQPLRLRSPGEVPQLFEYRRQALLLAQVAIDANASKKINLATMRAIVPELIANVKKANPHRRFLIAKGRVIARRPTAIDLQFVHHDANDTRTYSERQLFVFVSATCRIDGVVSAAHGNVDRLEAVVLAFRQQLLQNYRDQLWTMPNIHFLTWAIDRPDIFHYVVIIGAFILVIFVRRRRRRQRQPLGSGKRRGSIFRLRDGGKRPISRL